METWILCFTRKSWRRVSDHQYVPWSSSRTMTQNTSASPSKRRFWCNSLDLNPIDTLLDKPVMFGPPHQCGWIKAVLQRNVQNSFDAMWKTRYQLWELLDCNSRICFMGQILFHIGPGRFGSCLIILVSSVFFFTSALSINLSVNFLSAFLKTEFRSGLHLE